MIQSAETRPALRAHDMHQPMRHDAQSAVNCRYVLTYLYAVLTINDPSHTH